MAGSAVPTYLPHFSLLYTSTGAGAAEAPAPLPHLSFVMRAAGSFNSARNPAPLPSFSGILGSTSAYRINLDVGSYTITGGNVEADYQMAALQGTYTLTGVAVGLKRGYTLSMASGSYGVNGQAVQLRRGNKMVMGTGSYSLTGQSVTLTYSTAKTIHLSTGGYALTGNDLNFRRSYVMTCSPGSYELTGYTQPFFYTEVQHYIVPYLIGAMEDSARQMVEAIHGTLDVTGSGGTVVSQSPEFMQVVLKGQVVSVTMGGAVNLSRRDRHRGLPPYHRGGQ